MKMPSSSSREAAETLAIQALGFLAEDPERFAAFLAATGLSVEAVRDAAGDTGFLTGVLDYMLGDERLVTGFADNAGIDPAALARAQRALGGEWHRDLP
jgi:2-hydroxychromene-2-carboxylate isomerase